MNYEYSGSSFLQRPRMSEQRPHTVHSSTVPFNSSYSQEEQGGHMQDIDFASAVQRRTSLSRDDTAADLSAPSEDGQAWPSNKTHLPSMSWSDFRPSEHTSSDLRNPHFATEESRLAFWRSQRSRRRQLLRPIGGHSQHSSHSFLPNVSAVPSAASPTASAGAATSSSSSPHVDEPSRKSSLSRRLSRSVKKMHDFGSNITNGQTSLRSRKASTSEIVQPAFVDPLSPSLTSPTKRNGKHGDERPKKSRTATLSSAERKDTPAPPFGQAPRSAPKAIWPAGGEGARQSAARLNTTAFNFENQSEGEAQDDIFTQHARLGSISSAADSGADLSTYARYDTPQRDCDGDVEMLSTPAPVEDDKVDFVAGKLPQELSLAVFKLLDGPSLASASQVNRSWNNLVKDESVWRTAFYRRWQRQIHTEPAPVQVGGPGTGLPNTPKQEWKRMYRARTLLEKQWRMGAQESGKATYLSGHTDSVYCVQFDEEKIITGSRDRTIRVWDINTMQCIRVIGGPNVKPVPGPKPLRTVDYPSFHSAVASVNGTVYGNSIYHTPAYWHDASILCLQYDENILVTGSSDSDLIVWDIKTYEPIRRLRAHSGGVLDVALDAKHIISCSKDSKIFVWDRETFQIKGTLEGHRGPVNAVQLRGKYLVSASGDGIARLWDIETNKLVKEFTAKERGLAAVEFSEDMKYVLAGGNDHITYKFETDTGREVAQFTGHTQLVRSLWLDSVNRRVVSGSYDLDLRVYDFETGDEIWRAEEWTTSWMLAAKSDYRRIVATSQDGRVLIIDFGMQKGGANDGVPIDGVDLLREIPLENTSAIIFRNPFENA